MSDQNDKFKDSIPPEQELELFEVHHWPIVKAFADKLKLVETINSLIPTQMAVQPGIIVLGMVLDTLSRRSPLYHLSEFFTDKDTELLLGETLSPEYFNDDNVGRVLDLLFDVGTNGIFSALALNAVKTFNVCTKHVRFDTTSVSLFGDYSRCDGDDNLLQITHGYSKDKRPDLKQFVATVLCAGGKVPLFGKSENGNASDKNLNNELLTHISEHLAKVGVKQGAYIYIADSAFVTESNLATIGDGLFITRLPATYKEHSKVISNAVAADNWEYIGAIAEVKGTEKRPNAVYKASEGLVTLYGKQYRAVVVHSSAHDKRRQKRLEKEIKASRHLLEEHLKALSKQSFYCEPDAKTALSKALNIKSQYHHLELEIEMIPKFSPGRPKKGQTKLPISHTYKIKGVIGNNEHAIQQREEEAGCFVLLTNVPVKGEGLYSSKDILKAYKEQYGVEQNFEFLKDDAIVNAIFLKKTERIEALGLVLLIALLIWRLMELQMRTNLERTGETLPGWDNKPTTRPTSYMMTIKFKGILIAKKGKFRQLGRPLNVVRCKFLQALGLDSSIFIRALVHS